MPHTLTLNQSASIAGKTVTAQISATNAALASIDEVVGTGTNVEFDIDFKAAQLKGLVLYSAVACTIKTNSATEWDDTFTLAAGQMITWAAGSVYANPVTEDVSKVFITNAATGLIQIYALHDPTA